MVLITDKYEIEVSRGDSSQEDIEIRFITDDETPLPEGTIALVSMSPIKDGVPLWDKRLNVVNNSCFFRLKHQDTSYRSGDYWWDIRLIFDEGTDDKDICTPFDPHKFIIKEVVRRP